MIAPKDDITFDSVIPIVTEVLENSVDLLREIRWLVVNRDISGRVRFIAPSGVYLLPSLRAHLEKAYDELVARIPKHTYPGGQQILYKDDRDSVLRDSTVCGITGWSKVLLVERTFIATRHRTEAQEKRKIPRRLLPIVPYNDACKRELNNTLHTLAQCNLKVLVLDMLLDQPDTVPHMLGIGRCPEYGILDWMVEALVGNDDVVVPKMLRADRQWADKGIHVVASSGYRSRKNLIQKLGRVYTARINSDNMYSTWVDRLHRLVDTLEERYKPDITLICSPLGLGFISLTCFTQLGASVATNIAKINGEPDPYIEILQDYGWCTYSYRTLQAGSVVGNETTETTQTEEENNDQD